jgi:hypothetical protein
VWAQCRDWLVPIMVDTTEAEVLADLEANRAQLWMGDGAAMVLQLLTPPPTLHIWLAGGELGGLLDMRGGMEAWARSQGCEAVTINGRRGWDRVLKPYGYEPDGEELRKALK